MKRRIGKGSGVGAEQWARGFRGAFATLGCHAFCWISCRRIAGGCPSGERNKLCARGLDAPRSRSRAAFFTPALAEKIAIGNSRMTWALAEADWIIEVVQRIWK